MDDFLFLGLMGFDQTRIRRVGDRVLNFKGSKKSPAAGLGELEPIGRLLRCGSGEGEDTIITNK